MKAFFIFLLHVLAQGQTECGKEGKWMSAKDLPEKCETMHGSLKGVTKESDMKSLKKIHGTLSLKKAVSIERAIDLRMLKM
ncbi:hypothetical protein DSO57_1026891 [Entomophthora muscae]|uniref:Uncharacterized protein n=1 Tax=Entomophthora muscae TaxID=34485 RepID=A0ACC2TDG1_9FUNG|nr:hypothetical protein DSO57_1026891 [Entomophthora muscae]